MAQFLIFKGEHPEVLSDGKNHIFDDGGYADAGEEGFSTAAVDEYCKQLGVGYSCSCMGRSPSARNPVEIQAEQEELARKQVEETQAAENAAARFLARKVQAEQEIRDRLLKFQDPEKFAKQQAEKEIRARYAAELLQAHELGLGAELIEGLMELQIAELEKLGVAV